MIAVREPDDTGYHRVLLCLSAVGLLDAWGRAHVVLREIALALLRGGVAAGLFFAGIDAGTTPGSA